MGIKWFLALFVVAPQWLQAQQIPHLQPQLSLEKPGRLLITQVYPGRKFADCCITEFTLHGAH